MLVNIYLTRTIRFIHIFAVTSASSNQTEVEKDDNLFKTYQGNNSQGRIREKRESQGDGLKFQIWSSRNTESREGVLMAKVEGGSWAPVCRKRYSNSDYRPTTESGRFICRRMNYRMVNRVGNVRTGYSFAEDYEYKSKLYNLKCTSLSQCTFDTSPHCEYYSHNGNYYQYDYYRYYYTTISCSGCKANTYISGIYCLPCPVGSTSFRDSAKCNCTTNWYMSADHQHCFECPTNSTSPPSSTHCICPAGQYFSTVHVHKGRCSNCPPNTYSAQGALKCSICPSGSSSVAGAQMCECEGGLYWEEGVCKGCSAGFYSYQGATKCSRCPGNLTSSENQSFCTCPPGFYWGVEERVCLQCTKNTYTDRYNNTQCKQCPVHSSSEPGANTCRCNAGYSLVNTTGTSTSNSTGIRCEVCPENYFSKAGSLNCTRCPHFTTAKPASDECYR